MSRRVRTHEYTITTAIRKVDPTYIADKRRTPTYDFSDRGGRKFDEATNQRGIYHPENQ